MQPEKIVIQDDSFENSYQMARNHQESQRDGQKNVRYSFSSFIVILALCGIAVLGYTQISTGASSSLSSGSYTKFNAVPSGQLRIPPAGSLKIYATNEYGHLEANYPYDAKYPGSQIVEPFKMTTIKLEGTFADRDDYRYEWYLEGRENEEPYTGKEISFKVISEVGVYGLQIDVYKVHDDTYISSLKTHLVVKYVKRELRSLSAADREAFLNAAVVLWRLSTADGRKKYGPKYTSVETLVSEHAKASSDIRCDQYHEGSGFLTHHLALQNTFEAALRAVDPKVTLPYWDFTIEGEKIKRGGYKPSFLAELSPMFSEEWFGSVDADHHIENSRWKGAKMPRAMASDSVRNSYGFIRSYWNNNNDELITRNMFDICGFEDVDKPIPTCEAHYAVMNVSSFAMFQMLAAADGHGPMHVQTGGVFGGCEADMQKFLAKWADFLDRDMTTEEIESAGYTESKFVKKWGDKAPRRKMFDKAIAGEFFHIYRSLWRSHMCHTDTNVGPQLLKCPESCDADTPFEECQCQVPALVDGSTSWENVFGCILNSDENIQYFKSTMPEELLQDLVYMFATTSVKEGEMLESASPADILFWMIHPVIERLLAAKRVDGVSQFGTTAYTKWKDPNTEEWLQYSFYSQAKGKNPHYPDEYECYGHGKDDDVLPSELPLTWAMDKYADANKDGRITNYEFYLALDPNNIDGNDYVFDHFHWDHCEVKAEDIDPDKKAGQEEALVSAIAYNEARGY